MRVQIADSDLSAIKSNLRKAHPALKPSHRIEAASIGLGFNSYAALRAALASGPITVEADDKVFSERLNVRYIIDDYTTERALSRAIGFIELRRILDEHPELTERGFDSAWHGSHDDRRKPFKERLALFNARRQEAYDSDWGVDQFELAWIFLSRQRKIKTINRRVGSYGLKHRAERLSRSFDLFRHLGNYVSNGMLIAAAYAHEFTVKPGDALSYNASFNISMETLRRANGWDAKARRTRYFSDDSAGEQTVIAAMYGDIPRAFELPRVRT